MKDCTWDSRPIYEKLIEPLRAKAREFGYALASHGTLKRDVDLIACPWIDEAATADALAQALYEVCVELSDGGCILRDLDPWHLEGCPGHKPHGRLSWTIHFGGGPYIDLAVMPRKVHDSSPLNCPTEEPKKTGIPILIEGFFPEKTSIAEVSAAGGALHIKMAVDNAFDVVFESPQSHRPRAIIFYMLDSVSESIHSYCDKQYAVSAATYSYCGLAIGHSGSCGRSQKRDVGS